MSDLNTELMRRYSREEITPLLSQVLRYAVDIDDRLRNLEAVSSTSLPVDEKAPKVTTISLTSNDINNVHNLVWNILENKDSLSDLTDEAFTHLSEEIADKILLLIRTYPV